jgi:hypothetical protein
MFNIVPAPVGPHGDSLIRDTSGKWIEVKRSAVREDGTVVLFGATGRPIHFRVEENIRARRPSLRNSPHAPPPQSARHARLAADRELMLARKVSPADVALKVSLIDKSVFLNQFGHVIDVEQGQAGGNGVLLSQTNSLVYYTTMVNDVYAYFATGAKNGGITPKPTRFPTTQAELDKVVTLASSHGETFLHPEALAMEVKASWVEATTLADPSSYVTMTATIPTYDQAGSTKWTQTGTKTATLAMVGMHVVGSANGHPEMIWATFEHVDNTPDAAYDYSDGTNTVHVAQNTTGTWLFSTSGAAEPFNVQRMHLEPPDIVAEPMQTIGPSNTIRRKPWGSPSNFVAKNTDIIAINNSVRGLIASGDVRRNYVMTGTTWTFFGQNPSPTVESGTTHLADTTMETYQQGTDSTASTGSTCFTCHAGDRLGDELGNGLSHVFGPLKAMF